MLKQVQHDDYSKVTRCQIFLTGMDFANSDFDKN